MKSEKYVIYNILRTTILALCLILFATCDVGLGPSVDTTAPDLSISNPTASAILKGTISLDGNVSDDTTIASVKVKFKGISSSNTNEYEYDATVDAANKKWSLTINTLDGEGVKDGNYELNVTATDNSGKTSVRTTSFYVDNTAPVLMVDTPDVKTASMNYDVQIEGKLYDQSEVKKLSVVICDASGNEVIRKDANVTNNSTWKATFDGDAELGAKSNAPVLANNGSYYYYVVATDAIDNTSEYFFHKPDVYTRFSGRKLDISEWASFDKGDTDKVSGQQLDRAWFNSIKIRVSSISSPSSVSIVPNFSYSSQDFASIEWGNIEDGSSLAKDASIVGTITPPANVDSPFKNETFKCYIFPALSGNNPDPFTTNSETGVTMITKLDGSTETPSASNRWPTANIRITNTGSARNFNISTELPETHSLYLAGEVFYIYIEIENASGTKFFASKRFDINPGTPVLTITTTELSNSLQMTTNGTGDFCITGTSFTSSGHGCDLSYVVKKNGQIEAEGDPILPADFDTSGEWSLPLGPLNLTDGTYSITFTAEISGLKAIESRTIIIDTQSPTVNIIAKTPDKDCNSVTVSGNANDANGLASTRYRLLPLITEWQNIDVAYNWQVPIDLSSAAEVEHTFEIEFTDVAGNSKTEQATIPIDHYYPSLVISDEGDWGTEGEVPEVKGTASDTHFNTANKITVTYKNTSDPDSQEETKDVSVNTANHGWSWKLAENAVDIDDGKYNVVFKVTDTFDKTTTITKNFTRDVNGPVFEEVTFKGLTDGITGKTLEVTVRVDDKPAGLKKVQWKLDDRDYTDISNVSTTSKINLSDSDLTEGSHTLYIRAIDDTDPGHVTEYTPTTFKTDWASPVITIDNIDIDAVDENNKKFIAEDDNDNIYINKSLKLTGTITDSNPLSNVSGGMSVTASVNNGTPATLELKTAVTDDDTNYLVYDADDSKWKWAYTLSVPSDHSADGTKTVKIIATDAVGKKSNEDDGTKTITIDTETPTVTVSVPSKVDGTTPAAVTVTVYDKRMTVQKVEYQFNDGTGWPNNDNWTEITSTSSGYEVELNTTVLGSNEGERKVRVKATDGLNESAPKEATFYFDTAYPTLDITASAENFTNGGNGAEKKYVLTIEASDANLKDVVVTAVKGTETLGESDGWPKSFTPAAGATTINATVEIPVNTSTHSADGSYTFTITASDNAGNRVPETKKITIDTTVPTVGAPTISAATNGYVTGNAVDLTVTASDTGSGLDSVQFIISGKKSGENAVKTEDANIGTTGGTYRLILGDWDEGNLTITATAKDKAGNTETSEEETFVVDQEYPTSEITTDNFETNETFSIEGTASDTFGIEKVEVYQQIVPASGTAPAAVLIETISEATSWTLENLPRDPENPSETLTTGTGADEKPVSGTYKYYAKATDKAGKTTKSSPDVKVTVDTIAPVVTIAAPKDKTTGNDSLSGESYSFYGNVTDTIEGVAGVGVDKLIYAFVKSDDDDIDSTTVPSPAENDWQEMPASAGRWSIIKALPDNTEDDDKLDEGHWYFFVKAVDNAGNISAPQSVHFHVDSEAPSLDVSTTGITEDDIYYYYKALPDGTTTDTFTLEGTASDSYGIKSVEVNGSEVTVTGDSWSKDITITPNTSTTVTVKVTDLVGKTASKSYTLYLDNTEPELTITSPVAEDSLEEGTATLRGTVSDEGSGVKSLSYRVTRVTGETETGETETSVIDETSITTGGKKNWTEDVNLGDDEGTFYLTVTAKDNQDNEATKKNKFFVDKANPTITETSIGEGVFTINGGVEKELTLSGTVTDSNALDKNAAVTISADGITTVEIPASSVVDSVWTKTFLLGESNQNDPNYLADGTYVFTITAKDVAGKKNSKTLQRTVTIDTVAPEITVEDETIVEYTINNYETGTDDNKWLLTSSVPIKVTVTDNNLSTVEYVTNKGRGSLTKGSGNEWTATTIPLDEGENTIYIIAKDSAQNETRFPASEDEKVYIDAKVPSITMDESAALLTNSAFELSGFAGDSNMLSPTVAITIMADKNRQIGGRDRVDLATADLTEVTESNREELEAPDDILNGQYKWTQEFSVGNTNSTNDNYVADGKYIFTITANDVAKRTFAVSRTITVDTTAPTFDGVPTISTATNGYIKGTAINLEVSASDSLSGVDSVKFIINKEGEAASDPVNAELGINSWTYRLPLAEWGEGKLTVTAKATDKAGNEATSTAVEFIIDQYDPVVTETAIGTSSSWKHENFTVGGKVTDTLGLSTSGFTLTVTKTEDDVTTTLDNITVDTQPVSGKGTAENCTEYTWAVTIPVASDESSVYTFVANATDLSGKSSSEGITRTVSIDTQSPELTFKYLSTDPADKNIMEGNSYTIEGTATDGLAGIESVSYKLDTEDETTDGITLSGDKKNRTWKLPVQLGTGGLSEDEHTIVVYAQDAAGNDAESIEATFIVDLANPTVEFNNAVSIPAYINENLSLTGVVTDSNPLSADAMVVKAYVNGTEYTGANAATYTKTGANGGSWSFTVFADTDGAKVVKIVATDISGKKAEDSVTITVDKTAPTVTVVNPGSKDAGFELTANVYDTGKGMTDGSVCWSFNENATEAPENAADSTDASLYWQAMTPGTGSTYTAEITDDDLGTTEGERHIYVKATDGLNWSTPVGTLFYFDKDDPTVEVTVSPNRSYTNSDYTLTVNAADANLRDVKITAKKGNTVLTGTGEESGIWKTFTATDGVVTNQTATLTVPSDPEDHSADGTYTFNITATDKAGKTAFASKTVTVDTTVPTVADTFAVPDTTATEGSSYRFSGTASDENGSGIEKVEISFTNKPETGTTSDSDKEANKIDASGQNGWSYTLYFADNSVFNAATGAEGDKEVHVRAIDAAGNVSPWVTKDFVYDKSAPTSTISQYKNAGGSDTNITANSFETGKVFELKGSASDTYGIANVKLYQQIVPASGTAPTPVLIDTLTTASWTLQNLPRDPEHPESSLTTGTGENIKPVSGTYKYYAKATDSSGKTTDSAVVTVKIDTTAPTVSITAPDSSVTPTNEKTGENSLSDNSYMFRGTAYDEGDGAVGVSKLMFAFVKADDAFNATEPTEYEWDDQPATDGNWSISRTLSSGTGTPADDELNEAHWYFFAKSVDAAGNESAVSKIHFHVDKASPTLTMTTDNVKDKENKTYYFKEDDSFDATDGTITLAGTTADTYGIKSVSITTKTGSANAVTTDLSTSGSWTHTFEVPANTTVTVTITATDNSDKAVTKKYTLYRDTVGPTLEIISPASDESFLNNTINLLKGTVSDEGSGVKTSINYSITKEGDATATKEGTITRNGESWTLNSVDFRLIDEVTNDFITQEGTFSLTIRAEDTLGNPKEQTVVFYVDKADPTLSETSVGTGGKTTNETFTLSGWVKETNELNSSAAVTISADNEGFTNIELASSNLTKVADGTSTTAIADDATFEGWYYWTKTFYVGNVTAGQNGVPADATILANGTYVFTITAKDVAGKTTVIQRTVKVDTTAPVFSPRTPDGDDYIYYIATDTVSGEPWMDRSVVDISVKVDDETNGSGINTVEYELSGGSTGVLRKSGTDWIASVPLSDGENEIRIKATDVAGNVSYKPEPEGNTANYVTVRVDTTAPVVTADSSTQDIITNVRASSFYLNIAETGSGIASVTATLGSGSTARTITMTSSDYGVIEAPEANTSITVGDGTETATHKITLNADALTGLSGSVKLTVKAADSVGNESISVNVANITIDTENPTIENLDFNVASGNQSYVYATTDASAEYAYFVKGGTFRITGRTRDNIGIENTKVQVGSGEAEDVEPDGNGWHIDVTPTDSGSHTTTVTVTATDKAGNTAEQTIKLIFDTTAPAALHIIDSNTKDLVFRVGNYNNDKRAEPYDYGTPDPAVPYNPEWDSSLDEDVGGKYSSETFGNTLSITLRGYYKDEGSGLRRIYYKFYNTEYINLTDSQILALIDDVVDAKQTIEPLTEPATKRVFYKVANGATNPVATGSTLYTAATDTKPAEYYTEIPTNFIKEALGNRDLHAGKNYLVLVAEDNVGNKVVDSAVVPIQNNDGTTTINTYYNYVLNVDTTAPSVPNVTSITYNGATKALNEGQNLIVNKSLMGDGGTIDITLTAEDGDEGSGVESSGIKSVELTKLGNNPLSYKDSNNGDDTYTVSIPKADVTSGAVSVRITDKAGNAADFILFSITNDDTAPGVTLTSHSNENDTTPIVNKTITLKGTAEDTNGIESVFGVYYTRSDDCGQSIPNDDTTGTNVSDADNKWVLVPADAIKDKRGANSWSIDVDTEADCFTQGAEHYFTVALKDKAGNIGYSVPAGDSAHPVKLKIDQLSDCPVITFTNINIDTQIDQQYRMDCLSSHKIYGNIEDDDGSISQLFVSTDSLFAADKTQSVPVSASGSWTYTDDIPDDGVRTLYFKAIDKKGTEFKTPRNGENSTNENELKYAVYITDSAGTQKARQPLSFKIDTTPPEIFRDTFKITAYESGSGAGYDDALIFDSVQKTLVLGGSNKFADFYVTPHDANGIKEVSVKIGSGNTTVSKTVTTTYSGEDGGKTTIKDATHNDYEVWHIKGLDVSNLPTNTQSLVVTVTDNEDSSQNLTVNIAVDNDGPDFDVTTHLKGGESGKENELVTGNVVIQGTAADNGSAGVNKVYYMVPTAEIAASINSSNASSFSWTEMKSVAGGTAVWEMEFGKNAAGETDDNNSLKHYIDEESNGNKVYAVVPINPNRTYWKVPVYFLTEDRNGNTAFDNTFYLHVNPDGDKPIVTVLYPVMPDRLENGQPVYDPETGEKLKNPVPLGGTIRITGTAEDDSFVVSGVYMQIDANYNPSDAEHSFNESALRGVSYVDANGVTQYPYGDNNIVHKENDGTEWWGIKVNGTLSWSYNINAHNEFNPTGNNTTTKPIRVRFRAVDGKGLAGEWSTPLIINVDKNMPRIGSSEPLKLRQYDNNGAVIAEQDYKDDMWVTGKWWLTGSVEDESGISEFTVRKSDNTPIASIEDDSQDENSFSPTYSGYFKTNANNASESSLCTTNTFTGGARGYSFKIPLDTDTGTGSLSLTLSAQDKTGGGSSSQNISIQYDNDAPTIEGQLMSQSSPIGMGNGDGSTKIEQSDNLFAIKGSGTELGSGFSRLAIYFKRTGTDADSATRIYNPALPKVLRNGQTVSDKNYNRTNIGTGNGALKIEHDLPIKTMTVQRSSEDSLTLTSSQMNQNIRPRGLVLLGGVYRLITGVSAPDVNNKTTVTFTPSVGTEYNEAGFVYALIVDNTSVEYRKAEGSNYVIVGDDGDDVLESVKKYVGSYNWEIDIDSKQIPDGDIEICCVVFDEAGNYSKKSFTSFVENNRPALAKVSLGTDTDGNGTISDSELHVIRSALLDVSSTVAIDGKDTENYKVMGKIMTIVPEIVGGNLDTDGYLNYYYAVSNNGTPSASSYKKIPKYAVGQSATEYFESNFEYKEGKVNPDTTATLTFKVYDNGKNARIAKGFDNSGYGDGTYTFYFRIYDSTENRTGNNASGSMGSNNSLYASLSVPLRIAVADTDPPKVKINPFYWKSNSDNSLYDNNTANGHIELEADLPSIFNGSSGLMDRDPKVSGKIKIEGTATDTTSLQSIWIKIVDSTGGIVFDGFEDYVKSLPEYTGADESDKAQFLKQYKDDEGYVKVSEFTGNDWNSSEAGILTDGYHFTVDKGNGVTSDGHTVTWKLDLDTEKIEGIVATDVNVCVKVLDTGGNYSSSTEVTESGEVVNKPSYKMDVVPYITNITTVLSSLKKNNPSVYARTALGHYPVAITKISDTETKYEAINIDGFNLTGGTVRFAKEGGGTVDATDSWVDSNTDITIPPTAKSGELTIVFTKEDDGDEVIIAESLNNKNNDDAFGTAYQSAPAVDSIGSVYKDKQFYNRQPNSDNNNLLTDDVELDVWQIDSEAVQAKKGSISEPVMAINPVKHDIGFAFVNGALSFSMPNSGYSYDYSLGGIDYWTSIGLAYDSLGNSYATAAGGDINASVADQFRIMTSRWGRGTLTRDGYNDGRNQLRLELIGQIEFTDSGSAYNTFNKERIKSPSIATTSATAQSTKVYLAYYDEINDEIRFKHGTFYSTWYDTWGGLDDTEKEKSLFGDYYGQKYNLEYKKSDGTKIKQDWYSESAQSDNAIGQLSTLKGKTLRYDADPYWITEYAVYGLNHNSLIAGDSTGTIYASNGTVREASVTTTTAETSVITTDNETVCAGKYVSIAAIQGVGESYNAGTDVEPIMVNDDAIIAVWWDGTNNQLLYSFNKTPSSVTEGTYKQTDTGWSAPVAIFGKGNSIGEYCKVTVDKQGGVHIAAYDGLNGDLVYAYIPTFDNPTTRGTCIVDSYGMIGTELNIDVVQDESGNNPVPYISYYAGSCAKPKMAYWAGETGVTIESLSTGAIEDVFTGMWESTLVPTASKTAIDHINIGAWKDSDGKLTWSTKNGGAPSVSNIGKNTFQPGADSNSKSYGTVWGNGSKNPVLGYVVEKGSSGFIETAQMK
ncbi:MAG: hypothetical protein J5747_01300 [Spirochaetaceae bacterium]|nr:hypothetical protein [Spirochaetaceae bacterium]